MAKKKYKIHPAIGIARLGDSDKYFIGPEFVENGWNRANPTSPDTFKEGGKIRPQAARFRIFEYVLEKGKYRVNREINLSTKNVSRIIWEVHLANKKGAFYGFNGLNGAKSVSPQVNIPRERKRRNGVRPDPVSRSKFIFDPKKQSISGKNKSIVDIKKPRTLHYKKWPTTVPQINSLGRMATDQDGNLLVIGGRGVSGRLAGTPDIDNYANNNGWFDDVADGPITAILKFKGISKPLKVEGAWVISAAPDFAPHISNVVTLYDVLFDLAVRNPKLIPTNEDLYGSGALKNMKDISDEFKKTGNKLTTYKPDFDTEILPILKATVDSAFVFGPAAKSHGTIKPSLYTDLGDPSKPKSMRDFLFNFLRAPTTPEASAKPDMPKLLGDEPYPARSHPRVRVTVTPTQYALLEQWKNGNFIKGTNRLAHFVGPLVVTPSGLDKAALMNCVGAAMYPGIEVGWQIREPSIFLEPFRIKFGAVSPYPNDRPGSVQAGHFTRQMALPWQADFLMCRKEGTLDTSTYPTTSTFYNTKDWGWWPAQRPDEVFESVADFKKSPKNNVEWTRSTNGGRIVNWPSRGGRQPDYMEMLANWKKFGFIVEDPANPGHYIETERSTNVP